MSGHPSPRGDHPADGDQGAEPTRIDASGAAEASIPVGSTEAGAPREWRAVAYDALPLPHERWGRDVLASLPLGGHETVVDVGAGTGRDTAALLAALPQGRVIAIDGSERMLDRLRERVGDVPAERLTVIQADLRDPPMLDSPADAILSIATLHWLPDHERVFDWMARSLRPGGQLRIDCGGAGNIAAVDAALADLGLPTSTGDAIFAGAEQTAVRLASAGFRDVDVRLVPDPAHFDDRALLERYLRTVVLGRVIDPLPDEEADRITAEVAARLPDGIIDYVRLRASARRPEAEFTR